MILPFVELGRSSTKNNSKVKYSACRPSCPRKTSALSSPKR